MCKVRALPLHSQERAETNVRSVIVGQRDILQSLLEFASEKERSAAEIALAQGIDLVFEEERVEAEDDDEGQYSDASIQ